MWTSVSATRLLDQTGGFRGTVRLFTDITARRQLIQIKRDLVRQLVSAQEAERKRIARELHDQMGQHVTALSLALSQLADFTSDIGSREIVNKLREATNLLSRDIHHLALELRPSSLDHLGLAVAVASYVEDLADRTGLEIDFHSAGAEGQRIDPAIETAVYRIMQEALTNVVRHAGARRVSVILETDNVQLRLIVEDDGVGFNVDGGLAADHQREQLGLAGMHERASLVGGGLNIESRPGSGTTVYLSVPLARGGRTGQ